MNEQPARLRRRVVLALLTCVSGTLSCTGEIGLPAPPVGGPTSGPNGGGTTGPTVDPMTGLPGPGLAAVGGLRRLTVDEYNRTVYDLIQDPVAAGVVLPADPRKPFDNDYTTQAVSQTLITGAEQLAGDVAGRLLADKTRRDKVVGCVPASAADTACLEGFIRRFGRLAWRRALTDEEVQRLMKVKSLAVADNDFYSAVDGVVHAVLQDPEFLFRIEAGTPVPGAAGLFKLTGAEMASRLSYFLWGSMPDDGLLRQGESGGLDDPDKVRAAARSMLARPAAMARVARFHALWMGYESAATMGLAGAMKAETDALMKRILFDQKQPWQDLFRSTETYVNAALAKHYNITPLPAALQANPSASAWVPYTGPIASKRRGLLSHASFLSLAQSNNEKQMTIRRGKAIRELLFCQTLPPKPGNVVPDTQVPKSPCKPDVLAAHSQSAACSFCHTLMDPVGYGLDNYDGSGKYRASQDWAFVYIDKDGKMTTKENAKITTGEPVPAGMTGGQRCDISGDGELDGQKFNGPAGLADLVLASPDLNKCATRQLYRFAMGRTQIDDVDRQFVELLARRIEAKDFRFDELLLDFVSSGAFAHRRAGN